MSWFSKDNNAPVIPEDHTAWLTLAKGYLGEHEILGVKDNQFILDCFKFTNYKASHDEVPWCAAFVSRVLEESGYKSSHSAWAFDFSNYGTKSELKAGAIVVFKWATGGGHVSIIDHMVDEHTVACCGGNQSDMVKISQFPRASIIALRWPVLA